jgi:hypothetical protein
MIKHMLSAVQNSVEMAALDAAAAAGLTTAGWMPVGFVQRQPPKRGVMTLDSRKLEAYGIRELDRRTDGFRRADQSNLLAAHLTVLVNCVGPEPSKFATSRRDQITAFCRDERLPILRTHFWRGDISKIVAKAEREDAETLLVVSVQNKPDDDQLGKVAAEFFGSLFKCLPIETNAPAPCLERKINRDARRYPVYGYFVTRQHRLRQAVLAHAERAVIDTLNGFDLTPEIRHCLHRDTMRTVEQGIQELGQDPFADLLTQKRFFGEELNVRGIRLTLAGFQELLQMAVVRATCHELSSPKWWPAASPPPRVEELIQRVLYSARDIIIDRRISSIQNDKSNRLELRRQREAIERNSEVVFALACRIIASTNLRRERGLRTYLMLVLGGLNPASKTGKVVNRLARRLFKISSKRFMERFRRLSPRDWRRYCEQQYRMKIEKENRAERRKRMADQQKPDKEDGEQYEKRQQHAQNESECAKGRPGKRRKQDGSEMPADQLWKQFKNQGRSLRRRLAGSDPIQPIACSKADSSPSDREDELYFLVDTFPFFEEYRTRGYLAGFYRELCELNGSDHRRWQRWLAGDA